MNGVSFVKLTNAKRGQELAVGQPIHINLHRVQAMWVVQSGSQEETTRIEMNVLDPKTNQPLVYYVTEKPGEIYGEKND